jgi:flagellar assembly protein FliH
MTHATTTTSPPRKFGFESDFKAEDKQKTAAEEQQVLAQQVAKTIEAEVLAGRLLDVKQLEIVEQKAYQAGLVAAQDSQNQQLVGLWQQAMQKLNLLLENEDGRAIQSQNIALTSTLLAIKKAFPALAEKTAGDQITEVLESVFEHQTQEARLVVRVADLALDNVVKQVEQLKQQQAFMGKVVVLADSDLQMGDCRVEWADGGLERLQKQIQRGLEEAIGRILRNTDNKTTKQTLTPTNEV